jgi:hypothetical protein
LLLLAVQERLAQQFTSANTPTTAPQLPQLAHQPTAPLSPSSFSIWQQLASLGLLAPNQMQLVNHLAAAGQPLLSTAFLAAPTGHLELMQPSTSAPVSPSHPLYQHGLCAWPQCNQVEK